MQFEKNEAHLQCRPREGGDLVFERRLVLEPRNRGVLGRPVKPADDRFATWLVLPKTKKGLRSKPEPRVVGNARSQPLTSPCGPSARCLGCRRASRRNPTSRTGRWLPSPRRLRAP